MKRTLAFVIGLALPGIAQEVPPAPPAAPAPPVIAAPATPPAPEPPPPPLAFEFHGVEEIAEQAKEMAKHAAALSGDFKLDELRMKIDSMRFDFSGMDHKAEAMSHFAEQQAKAFADHAKLFQHFGVLAQVKPVPPAPPAAPTAVYIGKAGRDARDDEREYRRGTERLDRRQWEEAIESFDSVIERKGSRADGALYWKAYAQSKLGRRNDALQSLEQLQKEYASSRWLNDAKALQVEVRQASGQAVSPERQDDEDLKILAINTLINSDPERAVPLLEKILSSGSASPKLKQRALFVLAQTKEPKARDIVARMAKGAGNPDLQMKAVEYLGVYGGRDNSQLLWEIYQQNTDTAVKRSILRSFMIAHDKDRVLTLAKSEQNADLRREAVQMLGTMGAQPELAQMYASETSPEVRAQIINAMFIGGNAEKIIEIAKTEKDPRVRREAIEKLGVMRRTQTADALVSLYGTETDREIKERIIRSLFVQSNAKAIVDLARKESDVELKKQMVRQLANMKSKEATDYMLEILK